MFIMPHRHVLMTALLGACMSSMSQGAEIADLSLEQLLSTEINKVSGASRMEQLIAEAPAAVTILTSKDIRRHGWRTLADLLRSAPGINISYSNLITTASIRGQTSALDLGSFMLLMIDGERLSSNVSDAALLGEDMPVDMAMIDRVEIVTGASSAVYGANAALAVINIITRSDDALSDFEAEASVGSSQAHSWRLGGKKSLDSGYATFSVGHSDSNGYMYNDDNASTRGFARLALGDFTFTALHLDRSKSYPYLQPPIVIDGYMDTRYQSATLSWRHAISETTQANASVQYGKSEFTVGYGNPAFLYRTYPTEGSWRGLDANITHKLGNHTVLYGFDYMNSPDTHRYGYESTPVGIRDPFDNDVSFERHAFFVQDFWRFTPESSLHFALRHETDERFKDSLWVPRLGLVHRYSPQTSLKLTYGESFRAHPAFEISSLPKVVRPLIPDLPPEQVKQWEARIEHDLSLATRLEASLYRIETLDQLRYAPSAPGRFLVDETSELIGVEAGMLWRGQDGSRLRASVTLQEGEFGSDGAQPYNSPKRMLKLNYSLPIKPFNAMLGMEAQYTSKRATLVNTTVPDYGVFNLTLSSDEREGRWQWQVGVYNLFDHSYSDPSPYSLQLGEIEQEGRAWRVSCRLNI